MGYCVMVLRGEVFISREDQPHALEALRRHADTVAEPPAIPEGFLRGAKIVGGGELPWVSVTAIRDAATLEEALSAWRWPVVDEDEDGNLTELRFSGEKLGAEDRLFELLAPFVRKGSQVQVAGEDGSVWRWLFDGGRVVRQSGEIVFPGCANSESAEVETKTNGIAD